MSVVLWNAARRADGPAEQGRQRPGVTAGRAPRGRVFDASSDHFLLRLAVATGRAGIQAVPRARSEQCRGAVVLRDVPRVCWTRRRGRDVNPESARAGAAGAAHQHEWRMELLHGGNAWRGVSASGEDDGERPELLRSVLVEGRHPSE